jgi:hypothetical protein
MFSPGIAAARAIGEAIFEESPFTGLGKFRGGSCQLFFEGNDYLPNYRHGVELSQISGH